VEGWRFASTTSIPSDEDYEHFLQVNVFEQDLFKPILERKLHALEAASYDVSNFHAYAGDVWDFWVKRKLYNFRRRHRGTRRRASVTQAPTSTGESPRQLGSPLSVKRPRPRPALDSQGTQSTSNIINCPDTPEFSDTTDVIPVLPTPPKRQMVNRPYVQADGGYGDTIKFWMESGWISPYAVLEVANNRIAELVGRHTSD
jgi:hypothetical protein